MWHALRLPKPRRVLELRAVDEGAVPASAPATSQLFVLPVATRRWVLTDNRTAHFPPRFRQPTTLVKYSGETDPAVCLNDYHLACQLGGATDDAVIIRNLPLHLADATRMWVEHLPAD